ncbi:MAG: hypothetical protein KF901_15855 [Myxococcales bacterium]|nr:hypothetical protein [Myxococcales bacterium]
MKRSPCDRSVFAALLAFAPPALAALALAVLCACGDDDMPAHDADLSVDAAADAEADAARDAGLVPLERPAFPAANAVPAADPRYPGMIRFLWDTWGVEVLGEWPPAAFMIDLMTEEPEVFGDQFSAFGFLPDPNDDLPVGFKRGVDDETRVYQTCAVCHVGRLPDGRTWLGLPNLELDLGRFRVEVNRRWVAAGNAPLITSLQEEKASALGPGRFHAESGDYPQVVPADFPPYFGLGERTRLNYLGTGGDVRSEAYMAIFSFGAGNPNPRDAVVPLPSRARVDEFLTFLGAIDAPVGPAQDPARVEAGRAIFARERCNDCHRVDDPSALLVVPYAPDGVERHPGDDDDFPRGAIATSRLHRVLIDGDEEGGGTPSDEGRADLINFIVRNGLRVGPSDGYRAADLRGVWATAPYLHNGSVPTLEDLLRPAAERPVTFERGGFTVDTTIRGNGNEGHELGTTLDDDERDALAAYLRTL